MKTYYWGKYRFCPYPVIVPATAASVIRDTVPVSPFHIITIWCHWPSLIGTFFKYGINVSGVSSEKRATNTPDWSACRRIFFPTGRCSDL